MDTQDDAVLSLRHGCTFGERDGSGMGIMMGLGEGEGFIRERLFLTHPCAWTTTVGPPWGRGPRPCFPSSAPLLSATLFGTPARA